MPIFRASRSVRAFARVSATRAKCDRTWGCTLPGVASPASQNVRPSVKRAQAQASARSPVTETKVAPSSRSPWSWARASRPSYRMNAFPWMCVSHLLRRSVSGWGVSGGASSSASRPPAVCWIYVLDGGQMLAGLVGEIPFAGTLDHRPVGKYLIPCRGVCLGLHRKQMGGRTWLDAHMLSHACDGLGCHGCWVHQGTRLRSRPAPARRSARAGPSPAWPHWAPGA